jgi:hypothetical protein
MWTPETEGLLLNIERRIDDLEDLPGVREYIEIRSHISAYLNELCGLAAKASLNGTLYDIIVSVAADDGIWTALSSEQRGAIRKVMETYGER